MERVEIDVSGGCQCGAVRYRTTQMMDNSHICHCRMCQKAAGNIFISLVGVPKDKLVWTRGTPAVWHSSEHVERGFCAQCGTPLFYNEVTKGHLNLTTGSLDHPEKFPPIGQDGSESSMPWFETITTIEDGGPTEGGDAAQWAAAIKATNNQHPDHDTETWPQTQADR